MLESKFPSRENLSENQILPLVAVESKNPGPKSFLAEVTLWEFITVLRCSVLYR